MANDEHEIRCASKETTASAGRRKLAATAARRSAPTVKVRAKRAPDTY
jgi:hypothetical protein